MISAEIAALPQPPTGDVEPHASVVEARSSLQGARQALSLVGEAPHEPRPAIPGWTPAQLRDLKRRLEVHELPEVAALQARLVGQRVAPPVSSSNRSALAVAGVGVIAGLALVAAGLPLPALVAAASAVVLATLVFVLPRHGRDAEAADDVLTAYRTAAERAERDRDAAVRAADAAGLPTDPLALELLADEAAAAEQLTAAHASWVQHRASLALAIDAADAALRDALATRGVAVDAGDDALAAAAAYLAECATRSRQQRDAERRAVLAVELGARRRSEDAVRQAAAREQELVISLRDVAAAAGIDAAADPDAICAALDAWRAERGAALGAAQRALAEWQQLQGLLDGESLTDLQAEAARRRERANELAAGLPADAIALPAGIDPDQHLAELRRDAQALEREHDVARGSLRAQRDALPDVAEAEEAASSARRELDRVVALASTIDTTLGLLRAAQERVHRDLAPILAEAVGRWLPTVSEGRYIEASVDPASLAIRVKEAQSGQWRDARLLSEGTREQIYLLLRVAMAEHLVITGERAPLLLDEVTAQADGDRKRELLAVLHRLSQERQVIVFTHDDEVAGWAEAQLHAPDDALIRLEPLAAISIAAALDTPNSEPMIPVAID